MKNKLFVLCFASIFFFSCKNNRDHSNGADKERKEEIAFTSYGADFKIDEYLTAAEMEELL